MAFSPPVAPDPDPDATGNPFALNNVRVYVPKVARAIYGPTYSDADAEQQLNADQLKDLTADAIGKLIFLSNGLWPYQLIVTRRTLEGYAYEYEVQGVAPPGIAPPVTAPPIQDESLIVAQAALDFFFFEFKDMLMTSEISDVAGQKWAYSRSANVLQDTLKGLRADRDKGLANIVQRYGYVTEYVSFIAERDALTSAMVEWWVRPGLTMPSGQEIFPTIAAFGG